MTKIYRSRWLIVFLTVLFLGFHGWSLLRFPLPFVDEAWNASRAWGFLQTGRIYGSLDSDFMQSYKGYGSYFPIFPILAYAISFWLRGAPTLCAARFVSLLFGFFLVGSVYVLALWLKGREYALLSALLVVTSLPFSFSAHLARSDIMAAGFGYAALAFYFYRRSSHRGWWNVVAGLLVGVAFECHAHAAIYGPVLLSLEFYRWRGRIFRKRSFYEIVLGGGLGLGLYGSLHLLPSPRTYFEFNRIFFSATHTPPLLTGDPRVILKSFADLALSLWEIYPIGSILIVFVLFALVRSLDGESNTVAVLAGALILFGALLIRNKMSYYTILITPGLDLAIAYVVWLEITRARQRTLWAYARRVLILAAYVASVLLIILQWNVNIYPYYLATQERLNEVIRPDDAIIGTQTYWFDLYTHDYDSWEELVYYQRYRPGSTVAEALAYLRPDVFIIDDHADGFITDEPGEELYAQFLTLSRREFEEFLASHAVLEQAFDNEVYGTVRVYRIRWR